MHDHVFYVGTPKSKTGEDNSIMAIKPSIVCCHFIQKLSEIFCSVVRLLPPTLPVSTFMSPYEWPISISPGSAQSFVQSPESLSASNNIFGFSPVLDGGLHRSED